MDFLERARAGVPTSQRDPDIGLFREANARALALCRRFNSCVSDEEGRAVLGELLGRPLAGDTTVMPTFWCDVGSNITIGKGCIVNYDCVFLDSAEIEIGDHVLIAPKVCLATPDHDFPPEERRFVKTRARRIVVEDGAWIGAGAVVLGGVTIGEDAIVGAGAVVTRDVPPGERWAGVPAGRLRRWMLYA